MIFIVFIGLLMAAAISLHLREALSRQLPLEKAFPLYKIENDTILSKQGDCTVVFQLQLPEIFTLSGEDLQQLHQLFVKAVRLLPAGTIIHKQDYFCHKTYQPVKAATTHTFLGRASEAHFTGRPFIEHACYLLVTRKASNRKPSSSMISNLLNPPLQQTMPEQKEQLDFFQKIGQFEKILTTGGFLKPRRLNNDELAGTEDSTGFIERYCYLMTEGEPPQLRDIVFKPEWKIGENFCQLFSLGDVEDMPAQCSPKRDYDKFSTDKTRFPISFAAPIGQLLNCNHMYNQVIEVLDTHKTIKALESKRRRLQSLSAYSRENAHSMEATNDYLNETVGDQRLPVRAHFNLLCWTDDHAQLNDLRNMSAAAIAQMDATPRQETYGAAQLYWACLPGNAGDMPANEMFDTFAEQACCFFNYETGYSSAHPDEGIRMCDRFGVPKFLDLYDAPRLVHGTATNMGTMLIGPSGAGKSMAANALLNSLYEKGAHVVVIDIGGSYKGLCELVGGYYFTYDEDNPFAFNPFYLADGMVLDTEKKESLKSLLVALWKQENDQFYRSEYVALSNGLQGYYQYLSENPQVFPCFNSFYDYLQDVYIHELKSFNIKDSDFDVNNFLYVLRPYYKGGEFSFLLNATENLDMLNQRFVVFELDQIVGNKILFGVLTLIIMELFISKMRKLKGIRKVLAIDEAWKAITQSGMAEFARYAWKTFRKFNGIPIVISQELDDLISNAIIREAIINNSDIKIIMDMRKYVNKFDGLQAALGLSDKAKTILLSANKENRELFIDIGGQVQKVYKNELCKEEYYAFTTEGKERIKVLEYAAKHGGMEKGIERLIRDLPAKAS